MQQQNELVDMTRRVAVALMRKGKRAAQDPISFYEMVMREEASRRAIKAAPHQRVVLKFIQDHPHCVVRLPPGFAKTYMLSSEIMRDLGNDPTSRSVIISAAQGQAAKPLSMVRDYIEAQPQLRLVFPKLQRSTHRADPWTQTKITIERPRGIRDPSVSAVGFRGKLPGSRIKRVYADDLLTLENTATPEQREAVNKWFVNTVLSRLNSVKGARCCITNTPYHPDDLTFVLERNGWPTLQMTIAGDITITNSDEWDCDDIRPSEDPKKPGVLRLSAHDSAVYDPAQQHLPPHQRVGTYYDAADEVFLWPEVFGPVEDEKLRRDYKSNPHQYFLLYHMRVRNESDGYIRTAWVDVCKTRAHVYQLFYPPKQWHHGPCYTGVDLAVGTKKKNDQSSVFTFGLTLDNSRAVLRVDTGRWSGEELIDIIADHHRMFGGVIRVETNGAQDFLRQMALMKNRSLPIKRHNTGSNKHNREFGVESVFAEIENGAWLIPNSPNGEVHPKIQEWIDAMFFYDPSKHTPDVMIACWLARMQAWTKIKPKKGDGSIGRQAAAIPGAMGGLLSSR